MSFIFDYSRRRRIGLPECILCEGKDVRTLNALLAEIIKKKKHPVLLTRLSEQTLAALNPAYVKKLDYHGLSKTALIFGTFRTVPRVSVAVVTAGSSDLSVAWEARRTLDYLGVKNRLFADIGVAGLWRLEKNIKAINRADVVIAVAGMDAAIISVLGGLTARPLIAIPTSVGYGVAAGGKTALRSMLASCAPGVAVVNIDNGFGAACAAYRILQSCGGKK